MDANYEKKAIARQNAKWLTRKKPKCNLQKGHPWLSSDPTAIRKKEKMWKDHILPENKSRHPD